MLSEFSDIMLSALGCVLVSGLSQDESHNLTSEQYGAAVDLQEAQKAETKARASGASPTVSASEWREVVRTLLIGRSRNAKHLCERLAAMRDEEMIEVLTLLVERGGNDLGIIKGQTRIDLFANRV